ALLVLAGGPPLRALETPAGLDARAPEQRESAAAADAAGLEKARGALDRTLEFATEYKQPGPMPDDPQGDASLLAFTGATPKVNVGGRAGQRKMPLREKPAGANDLNPVIEDREDDYVLSEPEIKALGLDPAMERQLLVDMRNARLPLQGRRNPIRVAEM